MEKYIFRPYDPAFKTLFENEKNRISKILTNIDHKIEHIGSTSVPGLGGKGVIDIMVAIPKEQMDPASKAMEKLGYDLRPSASNEYKWFFRADLPDEDIGDRLYHLHLTSPESSYWQDDIKFRDYLIAHPDERDKYIKIKRKAVEVANGDRDKYKAAKAPFLEEITRKIKSEH